MTVSDRTSASKYYDHAVLNLSPAISSVSPSHGRTASNTTLTIAGENFQCSGFTDVDLVVRGDLSVTLKPCEITNCSATIITYVRAHKHSTAHMHVNMVRG